MTSVYIDLETGPADELYSRGPDFVRLAGYAIDDGPVVITEDMSRVVSLLNAADRVVGHNIVGFDLPALQRYHGLDADRLIAQDRVLDTIIVARQAFPPLSGATPGQCRYDLDSVAARLGVPGKLGPSGEPVLKRLAKQYGGYDMIPVGDPVYQAYLRQDVEAVRQIAARLPVDQYCVREHHVLWRLGAISRVGWRVDQSEIDRQIAAAETSRHDAKQVLHREFGVPDVGKNPCATSAGKRAVAAAFAALGVALPRTSTGQVSLARDSVRLALEEYFDDAAVQRLGTAVLSANGARCFSENVRSSVCPDGRVHPSVAATQATGRFSVTRPGLTVCGKRDRRNSLERAMFLPDVGELLLACDLSAVDARAMCALSGDPDYATLLQPGVDIHDAMASQLFGPHTGEGHHPRRSDAKVLVHATNYGMGARRLAAQSGMSVREAEEMLCRFESAFPLLNAARNEARALGRVPGAVLTTPMGRNLRVDPDHSYTQAPAALGQSLARDFLAEGVLRLPDWMVPCLRAAVHDELVVSVPADRVDEARASLLHSMQFYVEPLADGSKLPILANCSPAGRDWADCYRDEKKSWPEVARSHREQATCDDPNCTWHRPSNPVVTTPPAPGLGMVSVA